MNINATNNTNINQGGVFAVYQRRIVGLDLFRISLAILICMFHSWVHFGCSYSILTDFVSVGAIAMTGFFLLSGYSLRLVYGEQNLMEKQNFLKFYLNRILGIFPLYYFVALLYVLFIGRESCIDNILLFPIEILGLQSTFSSIFNVTHNSGTWFISCFILAYLIYPFLQSVTRQLKAQHKVILLLILVFIDIWAPVITHRFNIEAVYSNPFYRIVEFACGMLLADINMTCNSKFLNALRSWWVLIITIAVLLVGISFMQSHSHFEDYMQLNVLALPCYILMLFSLGNIEIPFIEKSKVIPYLSKISYAFFLAQFFCWKTGKHFIKAIDYDQNWVRVLYAFAFCIAASIFMYEIVHKPIRNFVNKYVQ